MKYLIHNIMTGQELGIYEADNEYSAVVKARHEHKISVAASFDLQALPLRESFTRTVAQVERAWGHSYGEWEAYGPVEIDPDAVCTFTLREDGEQLIYVWEVNGIAQDERFTPREAFDLFDI